MSYSDYYFPDHNAPLINEVVANAPDDVKSKCSNNKYCIFDYIHTNNLEIGKGTAESITYNTNYIIIASKTTLCELL